MLVFRLQLRETQEISSPYDECQINNSQDIQLICRIVVKREKENLQKERARSVVYMNNSKIKCHSNFLHKVSFIAISYVLKMIYELVPK